MSLTTLPLNTLLAPLVAAAVAIGASLAVERWGGRIGGVVGSMPTAVVPAAIGLHADLDTDSFQTSMAMVPVGMLVNTAFLWTWRVLPPRLGHHPVPVLLAIQVTASLSLWAALAAAAVASSRGLQTLGVAPLLTGTAALAAHIVIGVLACLGAAPPRGERHTVPLSVIAARGVLAGCAIAVALALGHVGSSFVAGMASVFPAIFLTTLVSLWISQGSAVPLGAVGPMMLGSTSVGSFALGAALLMPRLGAAGGVVVAWVAAVTLVTVPSVRWLSRGGPAIAAPATASPPS